MDKQSEKQLVLTIFSNYSYLVLSTIVFTCSMILLLWTGQFLFFEPLLTFHIPSEMIFGFILICILSFLTSFVTSVSIYQILNIRRNNKKTGIGIIGSILGLGSGMCVSCSAIGFSMITVFGSIGISVFSFLYVYENYIRLVAIGLLILAYFFSVKNIRNECKIE